MGGRKAAAMDLARGVDPRATVMRVRALRGSNIVEVEDEKLESTLCLIPAKFCKSLWIKRGNYVLVDEADRQKLLDANAKVTGIISQVLYKDDVKELQKSGRWPKAFESSGHPPAPIDDNVHAELDSAPGNSSDEGNDLPPLEQNTNRSRGRIVYASSSESDEDS